MRIIACRYGLGEQALMKMDLMSQISEDINKVCNAQVNNPRDQTVKDLLPTYCHVLLSEHSVVQQTLQCIPSNLSQERVLTTQDYFLLHVRPVAARLQKEIVWRAPMLDCTKWFP